jgi:hypothetical protein
MSVWGFVHRILVIASGDHPPTDQDVERLLADVHGWHGLTDTCLILSGTVNPTATQRAKLFDDPLMRAHRTAHLTDSPIVRGHVTAMRWLGAEAITPFKPTELHNALDHLNVPQSSRPAVISTAARLKAEVFGLSVAELRAAKSALSPTELDELIIREPASSLRHTIAVYRGASGRG